MVHSGGAIPSNWYAQIQQINRDIAVFNSPELRRQVEFLTSSERFREIELLTSPQNLSVLSQIQASAPLISNYVTPQMVQDINETFQTVVTSLERGELRLTYPEATSNSKQNPLIFELTRPSVTETADVVADEIRSAHSLDGVSQTDEMSGIEHGMQLTKEQVALVYAAILRIRSMIGDVLWSEAGQVILFTIIMSVILGVNFRTLVMSAGFRILPIKPRARKAIRNNSRNPEP